MAGQESQRFNDWADLSAVNLPRAVDHVVGTTETILKRPDGKSVLYLHAENAPFRARLGDLRAKTFTAAVNDEITVTAHDYETGDGPFEMTNSGGALPAGLAVDTDYFIVKVDADKFKVALTFADARADVPVVVDITGTGSGTHTIGGMPVLVPTAAPNTGHGSLLVPNGVLRVLSAPKLVTVVGYAATDVLAFWWT